MTQLQKDIIHLTNNLKQWHSLYDKEDLARTNRMLHYMKELQKLNRGEK